MDKEDYKQVIIGTGSYDTVKSGNTVSITGDGGNAWNYYGPAYKKLAPRLITYSEYANNLKTLEDLKGKITSKEYQELKRQNELKYIESYYETRLKDLNVYYLLETLQEKFGLNIILLCHEPIMEFCHRRVVADYIHLKTGIYIPEIEVSKDGNITLMRPISYEPELKRIMKR